MKPIYFDHHSTTPVDSRVFEAMQAYFCENYGNAGSNHCFGIKVKEACRLARLEIAQLMGAKDPSEIILTSGATESINLAIKGCAFANSDIGKHIITSQAEHKATLASCQFLETIGYRVTYLPVDRHGLISLAQLKEAVESQARLKDGKTILVSLIAANNEIGSIQDLEAIADFCRSKSITLHLDGAQTVGKVRFSASDLGVDLVSMSGHKIYGPKGIGALFINKQSHSRPLVPLIHGGGQEEGMRSGTLAVSLVIGLGKACELARLEMDANNRHQEGLVAHLIKGLREKNIPFSVNGHPERKLSGNASITFQGIEPELLGFGFKDIAVSTTSACNAGTSSASHVLLALGLSEKEALSTVRFGFGKQNTIAEVDQALDQIAKNYHKFARAAS